MGWSGIVGLDFGTATTLVATHAGWGPATVLPIGRTTSWLPSTARLVGSSIVVGEDADDAGAPPIRSVKRAITERRGTLAGASGRVDVDADAVITAILTEVAARADRLGVPLDAASTVRLGCPARWDGGQRARLLASASAAGVPVTGSTLIDEPVAAGVAWLTHRYLRHGERPRGRLLVVDMGGGTLDVAVLDVVGGPRPRVAVLACVGAPLGGDALDAAVARDIAAEMGANRVDVAQHPQPDVAWALLERAARETKVRLSTVDEHPIVLPRPLGYPDIVRYRLDQLEHAFSAQLDGAENLIFAALRAARLAGVEPAHPATPAEVRAVGRSELAGDVDHVLLAGGMSRLRVMGRRLSARFDRAAVYDEAGRAPEETVVAGLADADGYRNVRLPQPTVDLVLARGDGTEAVLYEAYTPLYEPWELYSGQSDLGYLHRLPAAGEGAGPGLLVARSSGWPVPMEVDGRRVAGIPVASGPAGVELRVGVDGRIVLTDGAGHATTLRTDGWPLPSDGVVLRRSVPAVGLPERPGGAG